MLKYLFLFQKKLITWSCLPALYSLRDQVGFPPKQAYFLFIDGADIVILEQLGTRSKWINLCKMLVCDVTCSRHLILCLLLAIQVLKWYLSPPSLTEVLPWWNPANLFSKNVVKVALPKAAKNAGTKLDNVTITHKYEHIINKTTFARVLPGFG